MNPFQEHAENMEAYEVMMAEPIEGKSGGSVQYLGKDIPATVGRFIVRQVFVGAGFSPRLMGQAIVRKAVVPENIVFYTGQQLTVTQVGGSIRECMIDDIEDTFTEWRLNLWDKNEAA